MNDEVLKCCVVYFAIEFSNIRDTHEGAGMLAEDSKLFSNLREKVHLKRSFYFATSKQTETV